MGIHGVGENDLWTLSNMQFLYEEMAKADKIMNF
ncbi:MAG: hypothetical protein CL942_09325 [Desulfovibrio sp.]|nr:hypothetical protein [Desulfovibrio sp.]|tara:strand:+ start:3197 stop:3298 length:102 start_codon:yes stop_codon:yes gene_type:complete